MRKVAYCVHMTLAHGRRASSRGSPTGCTPIFSACAMGHRRVVEWLIDRAGADAGAARPNGMTPVYVACALGQTGVVEALLKRGCDAECANQRDGTTPLMCASARGDIKVVSCLIRGGADVSNVDEFGAHQSQRPQPFPRPPIADIAPCVAVLARSQTLSVSVAQSGRQWHLLRGWATPT